MRVTPIEPTPGKIPSQLESKIKKNRLPTIGKNRTVLAREPVTWSKYLQMKSTAASAAFCKPRGTSATRTRSRSPKIANTTTAIEEFIYVLVIGNDRIEKTGSAARGGRASIILVLLSC